MRPARVGPALCGLALCGLLAACGAEVVHVPGDTSVLRLRLRTPPAQDAFRDVAELRLVLVLATGEQLEWRLDGSASEARVVGSPAAGARLRVEGLDVDHRLVSSGQSAPFDLDPAVPAELDLLFARVGEFAQLGAPLVHARFGHSAVPLGDGRVLVVGGAGAGDVDDPRSLPPAEIYDPRTQRACALGEADCPVAGEGHARFGQGACATPEGDAFVFGGRDPSGALVQPVQIFRYAEDRWLDVPGVNPERVPPREGHAVASLWVGQGAAAREAILVAGGQAGLPGAPEILGAAALFDSQTLAFTRTDLVLTHPRSGLQATRLGADGRRLLLSGGRDAAGLVGPVEVFDGANLGPLQPQGVQPQDRLATPRLRHAAVAAGGVVFVVGGEDGLVSLDAPELVVLGNEQGTGVVPLQVAAAHPGHVGRRGAAVAPLPSGAVLIAGGERLDGFGRELLASAEWLIHEELTAEATFVDAGALGEPLSFSGLALLPGGGVLLTGGLGEGAGGLEAADQVWYYNPR